MRVSVKKRAIVVAGLIAAGMGACSDPADDNLRLLGDDEEEDFEEIRLRALQTMKVISTDNNTGEQAELEIPVSTPDEIEASQLPFHFVYACAAELGFTTNGQACSFSAGLAAHHLCAANMFLELASLRHQPIELDLGGANTYTYTIGSQSSGVNAALARYASYLAHKAFKDYREALISATTQTCTLTHELRPGLTVAEAIGAGFVDAYTTYRESIDTFTRNTVAVADAQISATSSLAKGTSWAISANALSRAAAVHGVVGGDPGLFHSTMIGGTDWCSVPEPTPSVRAAIEVFREAGTDPNDILMSETELPIMTLLESADDCGQCVDWQDNPAPPNFSVRERLADRWGQEDNLLLGTTPTLLEYFNLTKADFQAAREYLASEIKAFSRSLTATLPPPPKAGGLPTNVPLFAAVANTPPVRPPQYFAAIAKWTVDPREPIPTGTTGDPYDHDLATFVDWALTSAWEETQNAGSVTDPVARAQLFDPIAMLVADSGNERVGRVVVNRISDGRFSIGAFGLGIGDQARVVQGEDGLACAVSGSIEGAPCDVDSTSITLLNLDTVPAGALGPFKQAVYSVTQSPLSSGTHPPETRYYVVRRKTSAAGIKTFEALAGFRLRTDAVAEYSEGFPIVPEAEEQAGKFLAVDRNWCSRTRVSCAGVELDARVPLEDELSDDSNGVENSWKHYVNLARRAAEDADALGEAVLGAGEGVTSAELTIAGRAEAALEEVQGICGADVDIEQLRNMIGGDTLDELRTETACTTDANCAPSCVSNLCVPTGAACTTNEDCSSDMQYQCAGGYCVGDLLKVISTAADKYPELRRIADCVDAGEVLDFVTAGSRDLCVWKKNGQTTQVCVDHTAEYPCPEVADSALNCNQFDTPAPDTTYGNYKVPITDKLGYFDYANESAGIQKANICETIRSLRRTHPDATALSALKASQLFHPAKLKSVASRVAFEPRFGSHSAILLDNQAIFQTGDHWAGNSAKWPCNWAVKPPGITCKAGDTNLMCQTYLCTGPSQRAQFNRRFMNATIALRGMIGKDPSVPPEFPGTMFPMFGTYDPAQAESINKFTRDRLAIGLTPVEVHEVRFKNDPRKFTFYYVNSGLSDDTYAWRDLSMNGSFVDYHVTAGFPPNATAFVVLEHMPGLKLTMELWAKKYDYIRIFDGLSSAAFPQKGYYTFDQYFKGASGELFVPRWGPTLDESCGNGDCSIIHPGSLPPGVTFITEYLSVTGIKLETNVDTDTKVALDALELVCEVGRVGEYASTCNLAAPPNIALEGWPAAKRYLECAASEMERRGALTIFADFPKKAFDALRKESKIGSYPALGGDYGAAVSRLRGALVDLSEVTGLVASELRSVGVDFEQVETSVALSSVYKEKSEVQHEAMVANQVAQCLTAQFGSATIDPVGAAGNQAAAWATCVNSYAQIKFAGKLKQLESQEADLLADDARLKFRERFETHVTNLQTYGARLSKASEEIDASLGELDNMRDKARRALYRALLDNSTVAKKQAALLSVGKARFGTAQRRYEAARHNAVLAAFIAKRSIEARLGVRLTELKEDLPLVAAPATWEATVCSSSGVSFDDIVRDGGAKDYADAYIGDYVDKLENVVESYRLVNNFHEGTDTAIVSLKDDFNRVKKECSTSVDNLLFHSGDFTQAGFYPVGSTVADFPDIPAEKWALAGCASGNLPDCVGVSALGEDDGPFPQSVPKLSSARGYQLQYGHPSGTCNPTTCGYQAGAYLAQRIDLVPGQYRLSWHTRQPSGGLTGVGLAALSGPSVTALDTEGALDVGPSGGWYRRWRLYNVAQSGAHAVLIGPGGSTGGAIDLAGVMLELAPGAISADVPATFANTGATRERMLPTCADTDGGVFRASKWRRGCVQLCADGFGASCDGTAAQTYCYRETLVSFTQADIDSGRIFGASGIAKGNFNYRIERVGLNFTGTGLRNCETSPTPLSCYGSGYWTYSLQHGGPYHVRNYTGQDVEVQLFTGNIEHARGLAAERYLTNPMSSADRELMNEYMRREFQGRPLDGTFVVRVWEEPGLSFDAMEDVQFVMEYRYWTRFN